MSFGDNLKKARLEKGLTQEELAKMIGVAKSTLTGYERGNREPDVLKIKKLAKILDIDANTLIGIEIISEENNLPSILTEDEQYLLNSYRVLDYKEKEFIQQCCDYVLNATKRKSLSSTANTEQAK